MRHKRTGEGIGQGGMMLMENGIERGRHDSANVYIPGQPITRRASFRASASRSSTLTSCCPRRRSERKRWAEAADCDVRHVPRRSCASLLHDPDVLLYLLEKGSEREKGWEKEEGGRGQIEGASFKGMLEDLVATRRVENSFSFSLFRFLIHYILFLWSVLERESFPTSPLIYTRTWNRVVRAEVRLFNSILYWSTLHSVNVVFKPDRS